MSFWIKEQLEVIKIDKDVFSGMNEEEVDNHIVNLQRLYMKQIDEYLWKPYEVFCLNKILSELEAKEEKTDKDNETINTAKMQLMQAKSMMEKNQDFIIFYEELIKSFGELKEKYFNQ